MPARSSDSACRVVSSNRSVTFDIADTTATTGLREASAAIRLQATLIRPADPTLENYRRYADQDIKPYRVVQTGPNSQAGGL